MNLSLTFSSKSVLKSVRLQLSALLLTWIFVSGCISISPQRPPVQTQTTPVQDSLAQQLRQEATAWQGTPHQWGGTSRSGIDCSAFVQTIYKDLFKFNLPRTTLLQSKEGDPVHLQNITPGDLVFYRIDAGTRHVGIYLDDNEFMHASKSQGVTVSSLNDPYWKKRFWTVRRILEPIEVAPSTTKNEESDKPKRITW